MQCGESTVTTLVCLSVPDVWNCTLDLLYVPQDDQTEECSCSKKGSLKVNIFQVSN